MKITPNHITEGIALLTAIWNYKYIAKTRYVYFIPYLAVILSGELGATYFSELPNKSIFKNNHIYLFISTIETIFLGYQFHQMFRSEKMKYFIFSSTLLIIVLKILLLFFFVDISVFLSNIWGLTGFLYSCIACLYLFEVIIYSNKQEELLLRNPDFWFALGILIFWVTCTIPFILYFFLSKNQVLIFGIPIYRLFPQVFSVVLYGCFIVAIILWKKYQK